MKVAKSAHRQDALNFIKRGAAKYKMTPQTAFLALGYFDSISSKVGKQEIDREWQLNALTCLVLACKFQERDDNIPALDDIIRVMGQISTT